MNLSVLENKVIAPKFDTIRSSNNCNTFLMEAIKVIDDNRSFSMQIQMEFYKDLLEAGDSTALLMEASSNLVDGIRAIIDKFLATIKKIFTKFITMLNSLIKSDKYLRKNKDKINKFGTENEFEMDIYRYTHIQDDSFPNVMAYTAYKTDDFSKMVSSSKDIVDYTAQVYTNFTENIDDWYDKFRGAVLTDTRNDDISGIASYTSSEFSKELFEKFRNGESSKTKTTITNYEVVEAYDRFDQYDKTLHNVEKLKNKLEQQYNEIKKEVKNLPAAYNNEAEWNEVLGDEHNYSKAVSKYNQNKARADQKSYDVPDVTTDGEKRKELDANITKFIKAKADQIDNMCKIHSMAFTAKLDAIKEAYTQDKALLYRALKEINKTYDFTQKESTIYNEACKDVKDARKFVSEVRDIAKKHDANYFIVTDGASGTYNRGNSAVENARNAHKQWEMTHGEDPNEDWRHESTLIFIGEVLV